MSKKIVFFDIDGTILDDQGQVPKSTKRAIKDLQERGVYTAIATGRNPGSFEWICKELNINSYVAINGAYAVFEGKEIHLQIIEQEEMMQLVNTVETYNHSIGFVGHNDMWALHENHPLTQKCFQSFGIPYPRVDGKLHINTLVSQAMVYCDEKYEEIYRKRHPNLDFVRFHEVGMDAMPKGNSKAVGIKKMIKVAGFKLEDTYAFGDGLNDIEMISFVGCGVAMGNAVPNLKKIADYVTTSSSNNGIWNALNQVGLLDVKAV